jgi:hypothetical protein|tara:strand:+ start:224 stop:505 length:282 start_codon:yes stop_codon:yes gene_type:complete
MDKTVNITYLPKHELIHLNKKAIKYRFNRTLKPKSLENLPEDNKSPVHFSVPVDDARIIRAMIEIKENVKGTLDILIDDFTSLPQIKIPNPNS